MNNKNGTDRLLIYIMEKSDLEEIRIFHNEDSTLLNLTDINHISELYSPYLKNIELLLILYNLHHQLIKFFYT